MDEKMNRIKEITEGIDSSELSIDEKVSLVQEAADILASQSGGQSNKMDNELLTRIATRLEQYKTRHGKTNYEVAEQFIRHIAFNPNNRSFRMEEVIGWKVIEQDDLDPDDITIHNFYTKEEAEIKFNELYRNGADKSVKKYLIYKAPVDVKPIAGVKKSKQVDLSSKSEADALDEVIRKGASNFEDKISDIFNALKDEVQTGVMNSSNPKSLKEAKSKRLDLQYKLEKNRAKHVFELLRDSSSGEKYLVPRKSWEDQNMKTSNEKYVYPDPAKDPVEVIESVSMRYHQLLEFDRFLSNRMEVSVGMVLATVHPTLAKSMGADPKWRKSLSGTSESEVVDFGRNLGSNLKDMIDEMAFRGYDSQLIFDREIGGQCIGLVRLSDVAGLLSDSSFILRDGSIVKDLRDLQLLRPPPPQIDASNDLSVAGSILKHGNDCVIIKFEPEHWAGSESELERMKLTLEPGYHIMTSHDVIAYRLLAS